MTKQTKQFVLWAALAGGIGFLYLRSRGSSAGGLFGSIFGSSTGTTVNPAGGSGVASPIVQPDIVALRGAAQGPLSRKMCALPKRWINTTTPPYYGFCVTQSQFNEWVKLPSDSQGTATESFVRSYFSTRGGIETAMITAPIVIVALAGAWFLFSSSRTAGPGSLAALTPEERERQAEEQARQVAATVTPIPNTQIGIGAQYGSLIGGTLSLLPGAFFGAWLGPVGLGAGVAIGWVLSVTGNDTLGARVEFARRLGFRELEETTVGSFFGPRDAEGRIITTTVPGLFTVLRRIGRDDLVYTAQNVIGKQNDAQNEAWMVDVIRALIDAGFVVQT